LHDRHKIRGLANRSKLQKLRQHLPTSISFAHEDFAPYSFPFFAGFLLPWLSSAQKPIRPAKVQLRLQRNFRCVAKHQ